MATTVEDVNLIVSELRHDQRELLKHIISTVWHMRGGLSWEEAWRLCPETRSHIDAFITERLKIVERTKLPLL